jgi:hypothetical protein
MNGLSQQWWMQAGRGSLPDDRTAAAQQDRRELASKRLARRGGAGRAAKIARPERRSFRGAIFSFRHFFGIRECSPGFGQSIFSSFYRTEHTEEGID